MFRPSPAKEALRLALTVGLLAACGDDDPVGPGPEPPTITALSVGEAGSAVVRSMSVELDRAGPISVEYWSESGPRLRVAVEAASARHDLVLARLRPERTYRFEVSAATSPGDTGPGAEGTFTTGPLPEPFDDLEILTVGVPTSPLTLLELVDIPPDFRPVVVDEEGYVVWYVSRDVGSFGFTRLADGSFTFNTGAGVEVVNVRNQVLARLDTASVAATPGAAPFTIHHDVVATSRNTVLLLAHDTTVANDTVWTGEAIWEWDPASGRVEKRWAAKDFFDPATDRGPRSVPSDWLHANSLQIGPGGNVIVSLFWLHEVFSIAPDYRSIEWRLGGPASSFDVENDAMEAGQHTAAEIAPNRILMFDNGRDRSGGLYSRALELELEEGSGSARIAWEFRPVPDIYAPVISSAFRLANGNTVVGFGTAKGAIEESTGPISVFEVTPGGRVLWKLEMVGGPRFVYRATPLKTLAGEVAVSTPAQIADRR